MLKSVLGAAVLAASLVSPVMAAGDGQGFFGSNMLRLGGGIGLNFVSDDIPGFSFDERATALEAFAGYEFNRWFAIEGGYLNGGDASMDFFDGAFRVETDGFYATALGSIPLTDTLSVYGRAGIIDWETKATDTLNSQVVSQGKDDGSDPLLGAGLAAELDNALVRLEYRMTDVNDIKMRLISLAVVWRIPLSR